MPSSFYPWHSAPQWANYAATEHDGTSYWYSEKPDKHRVLGFWFCQGEYISVAINPQPGITTHWEYTLEQRPRHE
jgi:hypothetical protein